MTLHGDAKGNQLDRTANGVADSYAYDPQDTLLTVTVPAGTTSFVYDYESRITQVLYPGGSSDSNTYNGLDARLGSSGVSGSNTFKRDGVDAVDSVLADGTAPFTPGISEKRGPASTFSHSGLKNVHQQSGATGVVSATKQYDAFGNVIATTGSWKGPIGYGGQFGYQEDSSGLKLLGHRYFDSSTGRFLTRDPSKDGTNWYGYCRNNPIDFADPTGLVKIIAYWHNVLGFGNHFWLVIIDNVVGSPTYGQRWVVSGYPYDPFTSKVASGFGIYEQTHGSMAEPGSVSYDSPIGTGSDGGIVLLGHHPV